LGIVSNTSISFTYIYYLGNGPSYNGSSGDWYRLCWLSSMASSIHKVSAGSNFESQHKISETLNKYFEESNRTRSQKQRSYYATDRCKDIKIVFSTNWPS
jgi:hypothetical protein